MLSGLTRSGCQGAAAGEPAADGAAAMEAELQTSFEDHLGDAASTSKTHPRCSQIQCSETTDCPENS